MALEAGAICQYAAEGNPLRTGLKEVIEAMGRNAIVGVDSILRSPQEANVCFLHFLKPSPVDPRSGMLP